MFLLIVYITEPVPKYLLVFYVSFYDIEVAKGHQMRRKDEKEQQRVQTEPLQVEGVGVRVACSVASVIVTPSDVGGLFSAEAQGPCAVVGWNIPARKPTVVVGQHTFFLTGSKLVVLCIVDHQGVGIKVALLGVRNLLSQLSEARARTGALCLSSVVARKKPYCDPRNDDGEDYHFEDKDQQRSSP